MAVAFVVSLNLAVQRYLFEESHNTVEIALTYNDLQQLSVRSGTPLTTILEMLKEKQVVTSIVLQEETIEDFIENGKVTLMKGSEVMNLYRIGHLNRFLLTHLYGQVHVEPDHLYLIVEEKEDFERIQNLLKAEFGEDKIRQIDRMNILDVVDDRVDFLQIGLGISKRQIEEVQNFGFYPIVQLKNSNRINQAVIKQVFLTFTNILSETTVIFGGKSVLGYPHLIPFVQDKIMDNQLKVGFVEFMNPLGFSTLSSSVASQIVRVHTIPEKEQLALGPQRSVKRYIRAVKERGIRLLLVHPFLQVYQETPLLDYNMTYFTQLYHQVVNLDVQLDSVAAKHSVFEGARQWEQFLIGLGILGACFVLFSVISPLRFFPMMVALVLYGIGFYATMNTAAHETFVSVLSFLAAVIFPIFAILIAFPSDHESLNRHKLFSCLVYLLTVLGICLVGASYVVGLLSSTEYLLGIYRFVGVKLSFVLPLILIGIYFYVEPHRIRASMYVFKRIAQSPIRTVSFIAILTCLAAVALLLLRSGNYLIVPKFPYEEQFRAFLETLLYIRPRTKEILIGYPFLILGYMYFGKGISRQWIWFYNMFGMIGLVSVMNSFCHLHTPLLVSLHRTVLGLGLGVIVGLVALVLYKFLLTTIQKLTSQ